MSRVATFLLTCTAVLATGAFVVSAASATNFTAATYPTAVTATSEVGNNVFSTEAGAVECKAHFLSDPLAAPSEAMMVAPTYTGCKAFGFLTMTITMEGCDYVLHSDGTVDIECPAEKSIRIVSGTCELRIFSQTGLSSMALSNNGSGIAAKANITGIAYTVLKDGFACSFNGTGPKTGASFKQGALVQFSATNGATIDIG